MTGAPVSVVTGGGSGIGRAIALSFALKGYRIAVADLRSPDADKVVAEIRAAGGEAKAYAVDVSDPEAVDGFADQVFADHGRVDVLCNNAGVTLRPFRAVWDTSPQDFEWVLRTNYLGVAYGLRAFVPRMRLQAGHKHVVNTSSMTAVETVPGHGAYTASKAAILALSDVLRAEFEDQGDDFGVTVLIPGKVHTWITASETLRPSDDMSKNRAVIPYVTHEPIARTRTEAVSAESVGAMVARAVAANAAYCVTHQPDGTMRQRAELIGAAFGAIADGEGPRNGGV
ncbi:MAG: short-chain dehydrogenase/reductase [Frankiales bacterium]|nr:short-chain dehydrogenase/reductase [Frankiales bacterium]